MVIYHYVVKVKEKQHINLFGNIKIKNMKENIVTFQVAKLAKEKNFKLEVNYYYEITTISDSDLSLKPCEYQNINFFDSIFAAPTQSILQKWLREEHNIDIIIWKNGIDGSYRVEDILLNNKELTNLEFEDSFDNYENALEKGLHEALKLI